MTKSSNGDPRTLAGAGYMGNAKSGDKNNKKNRNGLRARSET